MGQVVDGLTVERGTHPEPFTGEVLGVLRNGIAVGVDLIVIDTQSPAIERARGIWSGMSGSPLYASDGRLIGAVAYGLSSGASSIAGVTPALAMYDLLGSATRQAAPIELSEEIEAHILERDATTRSDLAGGLTRLTVPLGVSGLASDRYPDLVDRLGERYAVKPFATGAASGAGAPTDGTAFVAGGNAAVGLMFGDVSMTAVGTVTAACKKGAVLFGHPFGWRGRTALGAHQAEAVVVHPEGSGSGFKVAEPGKLVGKVTQDRLAGLRARLGVIPDTTLVQGTAVKGRTGPTASASRIVTPDFIASGTWSQLAGHFDSVFDRAGPGTTTVEWTMRGQRADGRMWFLRRHDIVSAPWDASWEAADMVESMVRRLTRHGIAKTTVDAIRYDAAISDRRAPGTVKGIQRRVPGRGWTRVNPDRTLVVKAGSELKLRVTVRYAGGMRVRFPFTIDVPRRPGHSGSLSARGGGNYRYQSLGKAEDFDELLRAARRFPSGDDLIVALRLQREDDPIVRERRSRGKNVIFGATSIPVAVRRR